MSKVKGSERFTILDVMCAAKHVSGEGLGLAPESTRLVLEEVERLVGMETAVLAVLDKANEVGIYPELLNQLRGAVS